MKEQIYKLLNTITTEGLKGILNRIFKLSMTILGIRISETLCYRLSFKIDPEVEYIRKINNSNEIKCLIIKCLDDFEKLTYYPNKIKSLQREKWIQNGAVCISLINELKMIGYMWAHSQKYYIKNTGTFLNKSNEVYLGPAFIDKQYRKKGLYNILVQSCLKYLKEEGVKHIYSTSSIENIQSIKTFVRCEFKVIGCIRKKSKKKVEILEFNRENLITKRFKI